MKSSKFLSAMAGAVAAMMVMCPDSALAKDKKIGIQLYSVMDAMQKNPTESVKWLTGIGYNVFELVQWGGDPNVFGMPAADFKTLCNESGAEIVSTHSSIQEEPGNEEEVMKRWRSLFEIQRACGGRYFIIPSYRVDYNVADVQRMCDYFNRVGRIAKEYGLKLGYHNHAAEFGKLSDSDELMWDYLVAHTDPDLVCFELDVYWCTKGGQSPVEYLRKYPKRIPILHIKDDFVIGESGTIDFEGIFKQFRKNGMSDYLVEIETPRWLREKTNADGSKYTADQINDALFDAATKSYNFLSKAKFVK